ncbi:MAG: glycosyltransferase [Blastocatellia bacterium]
MGSLVFVLTLLLLIQCLLALLGVLRFVRYCLKSRPARNQYLPRAAVIVPCRGVDDGFEENITALLDQDYREYEVIFVTDSDADPASIALRRILSDHDRSAWLVNAGQAHDRGQKIHNLCAALDTLSAISRRTEVLVFADADARPAGNWLRELVVPLNNENIGATTGFRWYTPVARGSGVRARVLSLLLSVWNASALSLLGERSALAWGGATAIRREDFDRLAIRDRWAGAVSDDYVLTAAVRESGLPIRFVPQCLVTTPAVASWPGFLEFSTRQMIITRVYAPAVWKMTALTQAFYSLTFWTSLLYLGLTALRGNTDIRVALTLGGIFLCGAVSGVMRYLTATRVIDSVREQSGGDWWGYALLFPFSSLIYLYNIARSALTRTITWRGIQYRMNSPGNTEILGREDNMMPLEIFDFPDTPNQNRVRPDWQKSSSGRR